MALQFKVELKRDVESEDESFVVNEILDGRLVRQYHLQSEPFRSMMIIDFGMTETAFAAALKSLRDQTASS